MTTKHLIITAILLIGIPYAIGHYTAKLTSTKEDTSKTKEKDTEKIIIIEKPGEKRTEIIREREKKTDSRHKEITQTEKKRHRNISALVGTNSFDLRPVYGISGNVEILGPITLGGAVILESKPYGFISVGVNF